MRPILITADMRAAESAASASESSLMERAGAALAEAVWRLGGGMDTVLLCGPGNNGGDGYVAARSLRARGVCVRVAALSDPRTDIAKQARAEWGGPVESLDAETSGASMLVDCLFGTGLKQGMEPAVSEQLLSLSKRARLTIACDLPSGVDADTGTCLSPIPVYQATVAFGALKPAHRLMPAMAFVGRLVLADIGVAADTAWFEIAAPYLPPLAVGGHKFHRGMVAVVAGAMPGAAALAASAAARSGAGYVRLIADTMVPNVPAAVAQGQTVAFDDPRIGALLLGPGLGRDGSGLLDRALASGRPLVLDADALHLLADPARLSGRDAIVTPHTGEFAALFGEMPGSKADRALAAAQRAQAVVVFKGADTLVAAPDGRVGFAPPAPAWLASAGTGDVLAG